MYMDRETIIDPSYAESTRSSHLIVLWIFLAQAISAWIFYVFSKFSCKIQIQSFSFAFPVNLTIPMAVTVMIVLCGLREANVCALHSAIPDYLFVNVPPFYHLFEYIVNDYAWVWLLWLFSQLWVTRHIWSPKNDRNSATEKLFVAPMYSALVIDQCVALNRQREDPDDLENKIVCEGGRCFEHKEYNIRFFIGIAAFKHQQQQ